MRCSAFFRKDSLTMAQPSSVICNVPVNQLNSQSHTLLGSCTVSWLVIQLKRQLDSPSVSWFFSLSASYTVRTSKLVIDQSVSSQVNMSVLNQLICLVAKIWFY